MAFDYDELNPLGATYLADYPGNEQGHRSAVLNSLIVDHYPEDGPIDSQSGFHRQISLPPLGTKPTAPVGDAGFVYTKDVDGITELFYENEAGDEVQLTSDGTASPDKLPLAGGTLTGELIVDASALTVHNGMIDATGTTLIRILNSAYLQGRDNAGSNWRDLIGVNTSDEVEIGDASLSADARAYVTDVDGLLVNYGAADKIVWNKGHFALPPLATQIYESTPAVISSSNAGGVSHGIPGGTPPLWFATLQCQSSDLGYSTDDEIPVMQTIGDADSTGPRWFSVNSTTSRFEWRKTTATPRIIESGGGTTTVMDESKWKIVFRAWF